MKIGVINNGSWILKFDKYNVDEQNYVNYYDDIIKWAPRKKFIHKYNLIYNYIFYICHWWKYGWWIIIFPYCTIYILFYNTLCYI